MELVISMLNVGLFAWIAMMIFRGFGWITDFIRA